MIITVGSSLPERLLQSIHARHVPYRRLRVCDNCRQEWETVEVPLVGEDWCKYEVPTNLCPLHLDSSDQEGYMQISDCAHEEYIPSGALKIFSLGGAWQRRRCSTCENCGHAGRNHKGGIGGTCHWPIRAPDACECKGLVPCTHKDKIRRWTTGEFLPTGIVCEDITKCYTCGGKGSLQPLRGSYQSRRFCRTAVRRLERGGLRRPFGEKSRRGVGSRRWPLIPEGEPFHFTPVGEDMASQEED